MTSLHPIQRRILVEELVRLRRADESQRYATSQRRGRIDPNPHQIDAVIFALRRIPEGGCILADEVGLGKTIEAGLVVAQLLAEGKRRILILLPKPLLGQWQQELYTLFGIEGIEAASAPETLKGNGVFMMGREMAGTEKGADALANAPDFDLVIIDEAHEIFSGIWRRYDSMGLYKDDSKQATIAHRVKGAIGHAPVLLLTATPIQNSLAELWGLVQYVEPTGTLLGDLGTFRKVFCAGDDRQHIPEQTPELRNRLQQIQKRTLRRQAQEFLETPFVDRHARVFTYSMSSEERSLYEDVTTYLLEPNLCAFAGKQRQLLLIGFHRRMSSSTAALAASLKNVAQRLERLLQKEETADNDDVILGDDLDDAGLGDNLDEATQAASGAFAQEVVEAELKRVNSFIHRAENIPVDSKAQKLIEAVDTALAQQSKVVIFTESLTTQAYLRDLLVERGYGDDDITLFRGENESPRAAQALQQWCIEVEDKQPEHARAKSRKVRMKLALVHEFKTHSKIFISTEAGAKGLNLQFCNTLINYDLPWNPQRIEQRIGRCHRYGQKEAVTVINFIAKDNETEQLLFEILMTKLDLFGEVLDASDEVIHSPTHDAPETLASTVGTDLEREMNRIYQRARNREEVRTELEALRSQVEERRNRFEQTWSRTEELIRTRLDEKIHDVFATIQKQLPITLAELDRDVDQVLTGYLDAAEIEYERQKREGRIVYRIPATGRLPEELADGGTFVVGAAKSADEEMVHVGHPLIAAAVQESRAATEHRFTVRFVASATDNPSLRALVGKRGRMVVVRVHYDGFEPVQRLLLVAITEPDDALLSENDVRALLQASIEESPDIDAVSIGDDAIDDAIEESLFFDQEAVGEKEEIRFQSKVAQLERYAEDRVLVLRRERQAVVKKHRDAIDRRDNALSYDVRSRAIQDVEKLETALDGLDERIAALVERNDQTYQRSYIDAESKRFNPPIVERLFDVAFEIS